jgi:PAS domain S-box-containing protein
MPRQTKTGKKKAKPEDTVVSSDDYKFNQALIQTILDESHSGIAIVGDDYTLEYINDEGLRIFGGAREDLVGQDFRKFLRSDIRQLVAERYELRRQGKAVPATYPFQLVRKDGELRTVEGRVSLVRGQNGNLKTVAHFLDITQLERGQILLEESQRRYRILVETMNDGLAIDDENGNLTYANKAFLEMLGYELHEILGKPWNGLTSELDLDSVKQKISDRKKGVSEKYELAWKSKTGEIIPTIISATPLHDREGNFQGTFAVVTEISAQKDAEETVQFYLDLLSHDIANQLQVIMTSSGLLEEEVPQSYVSEARTDIMDAVERCNRLITKVKRAAQSRYVPIVSVDVVPVLKEKITILERVFDVDVHTSGIGKSAVVEADVLLGEMIWNLLENAARHNPKEKKEVWVEGKSKSGVYKLSVADDGPGLSTSRKEAVFQERKHGGGVGLTLVSQMVRKYGGSIEVDDRVEGSPSLGAKFTITLRKPKKS